MSGDLGGKQSHAFPLKTIKMKLNSIKNIIFLQNKPTIPPETEQI